MAEDNNTDGHDQNREPDKTEWPKWWRSPEFWPLPLKQALTGFAAFTLVVIFFGILYLLFDLLRLFFSDSVDKDRFSNIRTDLLILAALIGAPFLVWRTVLASRQTEIQRENHFTDLFTKAIEQLGVDKTVKRFEEINGEMKSIEVTEPNLEVRIGAIYALERIMRDSPKDAPAIADTIAAYIRNNCHDTENERSEGIVSESNYSNTRAWLAAVKEKTRKMQMWERGHEFDSL